MQFNFNCEQILGTNINGFAIIDAGYINTIRPVYLNIIHQIIDTLGKTSSKGQNLGYVSTNPFKFFKSGNERIYIKVKEDKVLGFIRVGYKKNSFRDKQHNYYIKNALCVYDFYVHITIQRRGIGKEIFDKMLASEMVSPIQLSYESMNDTMLNFLLKFYDLKNYILQTEGLLVFEGFFESQDNSNKNTRVDSNNPLNNNLRLSLDSNIIKQVSSSPQPQDRKFFANYYLKDILSSNNDLLGQINKNTSTPIQVKNLQQNSNKDLSYIQENYIKEKLVSASHGMDLTLERLKQLENNISPDTRKFFDYKKKNEYSTLLDLKSIKPKEILRFNTQEYNITRNTPTTSGVYGSYYNNDNKF